jgi:hypothetical protein
MTLDVVYRDPTGQGYHPVAHMARLAAELLGGRLIVDARVEPPFLQKLTGTLLPRRRGEGKDCLLLCPSPASLLTLFNQADFRFGYRRIVAWVFDSFWLEHLPRFMRMQRHFDHLFLTETEDLQGWRDRIRCDASWLPWGSDVLRLGSAPAKREHDVLRFGRQPPEWEDDESTRAAFAARGLSYAGRPQGSEDATENERILARACGQTKFTLSFTNRVSPSIQTHPRREYITSRWTIAAANGATVAGVPPRSESVHRLLWPEALLPLADAELSHGLEAIADAVKSWTPERAAYNHRRALERLDWRWRFKEIADALGHTAPKLDAELAQLKERLAPPKTLRLDPHARAPEGELRQRVT